MMLFFIAYKPILQHCLRNPTVYLNMILPITFYVADPYMNSIGVSDTLGYTVAHQAASECTLT
jgi:hypothetical protein